MKAIKRSSISPNAKRTIKHLQEVETIIKNNDAFCRKTKRNNIALQQRYNKPKAVIILDGTNNHRIINQTKGSVIRQRIADQKQANLNRC